MNDLEFREQYKRLKDVHSMHFSSNEKMNTIWEHVKDLDVDWFRRLVDRIVMAQDPRQEQFNIGSAAQSQRNAKKSAEFAEQVSKASDTWYRQNKDGLEITLKEYGANSLVEAIDKSRKGDL